jgi:hypothetical protein
MLLPELNTYPLPEGIKWYSADDENLFPEVDGDGQLTGRFFCWLISRVGEKCFSFGFALHIGSDIPDALTEALTEFQLNLISQPGDHHGNTQN